MKWQHKLLIAIAFAAVWAAPLAAQQPQAPTEYTIKVAPAEIEILGKALEAMPYRDVAQFMNKLREQIVAQQRAISPKQEAPTEPKHDNK